MKSFRQQFIQFNQKHDLLHPQDRILIGVSGGMDSMVLLHILYRMRNILPLLLTVCHVHHGLRGRSADLDEDLARRYSCQLGFPFIGIHVKAVPFTKKYGLSPEEGARNLRFSAFETIGKRIASSCIALAHQADDQAETILMNLARGSGIRGLGGIRPKRDRIIRPLLFASREEIHSYAVEHRIPYRDDPTNSSRQYRRNQIRAEVLAPLKSIYGSSIIQTLGRSGTHVQEILRFIQQEKTKAWESALLDESGIEIILDIGQFLHYFTTIQKELSEHAIRQLNPDFSGLNQALFNRLISLVQTRKNGRWIKIDDTVRAAIYSDRLIFYKVISPIKKQEIIPGLGCEIQEHNLTVRINTVRPERSYSKKRKGSHTEFIDSDKISKKLMIRSFKPGDWFVPLGMTGKKKLKDFFIDEKVPSYRRQAVPLLVHDDDIVCVLGYRLDDRYKITSQTKSVLQIKLTG